LIGALKPRHVKVEYQDDAERSDLRKREKMSMATLTEFWKTGKSKTEPFFLPSEDSGERTTVVPIRLRYATRWQLLVIYEEEKHLRRRLVLPKDFKSQKVIIARKKEICKAFFGHENFAMEKDFEKILTDDPRHVSLSPELTQVWGGTSYSTPIN